jgi:hypothetical protein
MNRNFTRDSPSGLGGILDGEVDGGTIHRDYSRTMQWSGSAARSRMVQCLGKRVPSHQICQHVLPKCAEPSVLQEVKIKPAEPHARVREIPTSLLGRNPRNLQCLTPTSDMVRSATWYSPME